MITSPHLPALLKAHAHQGESNDCGPYTVSIVVNALKGIQVEPQAVAQRMNRPRRRGALLIVRRVPNWATFPWGVADALQEYGLPARWRPFARREDLLQALPRGEILLPIIGEWLPKPWAHISILAAWDARRGWGFVDPMIPGAVLHLRTEEAFTHLWQRYFRLLVYVPSPIAAPNAFISPAGEPVT